VTHWPPRLRPVVVAEPPSWARVFIAADWGTPDDRELAMHGEAGATDPTWRRWHAWRRWMEAVSAWYDGPGAERDFIDDLLARRRARRAEAGMD
jgi:hypothetical protein